MTNARRGAVGGGTRRQDDTNRKHVSPATSEIATQALLVEPDPAFLPFGKDVGLGWQRLEG